MGASEVETTLATATPEGAWQSLVATHPELALRRANLAVAINRKYAKFDSALQENDEVCFIPPVSGG